MKQYQTTHLVVVGEEALKRLNSEIYANNRDWISSNLYLEYETLVYVSCELVQDSKSCYNKRDIKKLRNRERMIMEKIDKLEQKVIWKILSE